MCLSASSYVGGPIGRRRHAGNEVVLVSTGAELNTVTIIFKINLLI